MSLKTVKALALLISAGAMAVAGFLFHEHRNFKEPVVIAEGWKVKKLSDYSDVIEPGSVNDCNVYIYDSGVPGGCMFIQGGTHPEEPVGVMAAEVFTQNAKVTKGKLIVVHRMNTSGSMVTRLGEAYPRFWHIPTAWGQMKWRMGDRHGSPLDSWPDPEVYIHYPSGQNLAYLDVRNLNRCWPGRANGLMVERTCHAFMELIRKEGVNMTMDLHEAELEYPVENTIVAHQAGSDVAAMTSMMLTSQTFDIPIGMEFSPKSLHGLSHREIGDATTDEAGVTHTVSFLTEVAEPMLDRIRGITDEELLLSGKDRFVMKAGDHKLLYAPIDENGWPAVKRVARHVTTTMTIITVNNMVHPDQTIEVTGVPSYQDIMTNGIGAYFYDPATAPAERVYYD